MKLKLIGSTLALTSLIIGTSAFAQDAAALKNASLDACKSQVAQLLKEQQKSAMAVCECTVENTDYDALSKLAEQSDMQKLQADAMAVAKKCAENAG